MLENVVINTSGTAYAGRAEYLADSSRTLMHRTAASRIRYCMYLVDQRMPD